MNRRFGVLAAWTALLLLFSEERAHAQSTRDERTSAPLQRIRLRFGAGLIGGAVQIADGGGNTIGTAPGVVLRAGVQLDEHSAIFYQVSGTLLLPQIRNAILFEWTPIDWISVGLGPGVDVLVDALPGEPPSSSSWSLGVPLRLAFNIPVHHAPSGRRDGISIGVDVTPGAAFTIAGFPVSGFQLGVLGAVSYEMY